MHHPLLLDDYIISRDIVSHSVRLCHISYNLHPSSHLIQDPSFYLQMSSHKTNIIKMRINGNLERQKSVNKAEGHSHPSVHQDPFKYESVLSIGQVSVF